MRFEKNLSAGFLTNHLARLFGLRLAERLSPLGLAPAQFMALLALWEGDGITQSALTEKLDVEQATMANTLARMERDGLIRRAPHPQDRRAQQVWLTDRARALETPAKAAAQTVNEAALARLDAGERRAFLSALHTAIAGLKGEQQ